MPNSFANLEAIMNNARAISNESYNDGAGEIFTDTAPFTVNYINSSLEELQDRLENNASITLLIDNVYLLNLAAIALDPTAQVFIDYTGYYLSNSQGVTLIDGAITLPQDIMTLELVRERSSGSNQPMVPLTQLQGGLIPRAQGPMLNQFEWRASGVPGNGDALWMLGATQIRDISLRYMKREAQVTAGTDFNTVNIDLTGSYNALSYMIASRYVASRNPEVAAGVETKAQYYIKECIKRVQRQKQSIQYIRSAYGGGNNQGSNRQRIL